jgi:hypothetical protein
MLTDFGIDGDDVDRASEQHALQCTAALVHERVHFAQRTHETAHEHEHEHEHGHSTRLADAACCGVVCDGAMGAYRRLSRWSRVMVAPATITLGACGPVGSGIHCTHTHAYARIRIRTRTHARCQDTSVQV